MIAATAIQRFVYKLRSSRWSLTENSKSDTSTSAFWTGKWLQWDGTRYRNLLEIPLQDHRTRMLRRFRPRPRPSLCHASPPVIAIPHVDNASSVLLSGFVLGTLKLPSFLIHNLLYLVCRQSGHPIYSDEAIQASKEACLAICSPLLVIAGWLFLALVVGPIVASPQITSFDEGLNLPMQLLQPVCLKNNDTLNDTQQNRASRPCCKYRRVYFSHCERSDCSTRGNV